MKRKMLSDLYRLTDSDLMEYYHQVEKEIEVLGHNSLAGVEPSLTDVWLIHEEELETIMGMRGIK